MNELLVITQHRAGNIREQTLSTLAEAQAVKQKCHNELSAVILGSARYPSQRRAIQGYRRITVAQLLSTAIRNPPYDLILTGSQAIDDNLGNVGPMMAAFLNVPYATLGVKLEIAEGKLLTRTELDEGLQQVVELIPPALLAVQSGINEPRYASLSKIRLAQNKPIRKLSAKDLNASTESLRARSTAENKQTEFIHGTTDEVASKLAKIIESLQSSG